MRPLVIVGPTGSGKSELALAVAEKLGGQIAVEVVNADAMQLYRGMDIGTAKLAVAERRGVAHHQLDVLDVTETASVARYQQAAAADIEAIS
ncbi:MAG: isopentenyl transferase family protein, partial [Mycobacterium sp.]